MKKKTEYEGQLPVVVQMKQLTVVPRFESNLYSEEHDIVNPKTDRFFSTMQVYVPKPTIERVRRGKSSVNITVSFRNNMGKTFQLTDLDGLLRLRNWLDSLNIDKIHAALLEAEKEQQRLERISEDIDEYTGEID
jgi:hypothetical protein